MKNYKRQAAGPHHDTKNWQLMLQPWPFYGQLWDWTSDGMPDENKNNNCLPETMAMIVNYLTGVELPADYIKDVEYGEGFTGYTDFEHAAHFLEAHCSCPAPYSYDATKDGLLHRVWQNLMNGHPMLGDFYFSAPNAQDGHARAIIGMNPTVVFTADPWTGHLRVEDYDTFWNWSKNDMLTIRRVRCIR